MTQQPREDDAFRQLEALVGQALQGVFLTPDPALVAQLDQELPAAWTQPPEPELDPYRDQFTTEELDRFLTMPVEMPEGDLDRLAQEAINGLDLETVFKDEQGPQRMPLDLDHDLER
jgi:hypothetical protein